MSSEPFDSVKATTNNTPAPEKGGSHNHGANIDTQISPPSQTPNGSVVTPSAVTAANARGGGHQGAKDRNRDQVSTAKTAQSTTPNTTNPNANRTIGHYVVGKYSSETPHAPPFSFPNPSTYHSILTALLGRSLGQGTFGKVRLGTHLITGEKVAIKILEKDKIKDQSDVERVTREIHILKIVRHPNVI